MSKAAVELQIKPPLPYKVTMKTIGLIMREDFRKGKTLHLLLVRMSAQFPQAFLHIFDPGSKEIRPPIITIVYGVVTQRSELVGRELMDGDKIIWFLMYDGG